MATTLISAPAAEPISVTDMKAHLRVDFSDDDALIGGLIVAARKYVESITGRRLLTQQWKYTLDRVPRARRTTDGMGRVDGFGRKDVDFVGPPWVFDARDMRLPYAPLISVDEVSFYDANNVKAVFDPANYLVDRDSEPPRIALQDAADWPTPVAGMQPIQGLQVLFTVGYGTDPTTVPADLALAIKLLVGHWYENREASSPLQVRDVPGSLFAILDTYRLWNGGLFE